MGWKQIIKESDGSLLAVYREQGHHQTESYFPASQLPPSARHEDITDSPSPYHIWNGTKWNFNAAQYKQRMKEKIKAAAKAKHDDFDSNATKADIMATIAPFKTQIQNATTYNTITTVKDNALAAIVAL